MRLLAIDPGTTESAAVYMIGGQIAHHCKMANADLIAWMMAQPDLTVVCEMVASFGMPVGAEIFETCVWIGEFRHTCKHFGYDWHTLTRIQVKQILCNRTAGVNDGVIRQRLLDLYGGKEKAVGNKKNPGPLYGVKADVWSALAVAKAWEFTQGKTP